ncbi:hypothetical protein PE067_13555 [Paracoccus sp. DMF-8]|uniref:hypothetical protein n=1 Tax=Paracoccus sp. DMF-8 TaxID=3019445 RepID=UPI0023E7A3E6|nr:hypothetical protein [Paracoccus sp. DMF-8]MDF3607065.1 hypothetical protein [Paracoccus sp. DMF-8]
MDFTVVVLPEGSTRIASPGRTCPARDLAGEAAEIEVRPVHPLHRHAEGLFLHAGVVDRRLFQVAQQGRALDTRASPGSW